MIDFLWNHVPRMSAISCPAAHCWISWRVKAVAIKSGNWSGVQAKTGHPMAAICSALLELYLTYTDFEIGRLVNHLKKIGQLSNTLIFISIGDNGAGKEGSLEGTINKSYRGEVASDEDRVAYNLVNIDKIGPPDAHQGNYPLGWAQAANTPHSHQPA
jgi:hypothetical protein